MKSLIHIAVMTSGNRFYLLDVEIMEYGLTAAFWTPQRGDSIYFETEDDAKAVMDIINVPGAYLVNRKQPVQKLPQPTRTY
jgi:hypothetical protein